MTLVGLAYLAFEDAILSDGVPSKAKRQGRHLGRALVGAQVGLIVLSIFVTRSSALSLQAKKGLPQGNQIVGWVVLGKHAQGSKQ